MMMMMKMIVMNDDGNNDDGNNSGSNNDGDDRCEENLSPQQTLSCLDATWQMLHLIHLSSLSLCYLVEEVDFDGPVSYRASPVQLLITMFWDLAPPG